MGNQNGQAKMDRRWANAGATQWQRKPPASARPLFASTTQDQNRPERLILKRRQLLKQQPLRLLPCVEPAVLQAGWLHGHAAHSLGAQRL